MSKSPVMSRSPVMSKSPVMSRSPVVSRSPVILATPTTLTLEPAPLRPEWILEGNPVASSHVISRSRDRTQVITTWACTPGAFKWYFGIDETVHIIEGEVFIADAPGAPERRLGPGDVGFFPAGTWQVWRITKPLRKLAICRHAMPRPLGFALRVYNKLVALALGRPTGALVASAGPSTPAPRPVSASEVRS